MNKACFSAVVAIVSILSSSQTFGQKTQWEGSPDSAGVIYRYGNVGIGTTNPSGKLHTIISPWYNMGVLFTTSDWVHGTTGSGLGIITGATSGNTFTQLSALNNGGSNWGNLILQSGNGYVGIGTTSPAVKLHLNNPAVGTIDQSDIRIASENYGLQVTGGLIQGIGAYGSISTVHNGTATERIRITNTGNVGIGTTNPGSKINTGAYFKPSLLGKNFDIYSATNEAILNLRSNQNSNGAHIGGIYFTRDAGQSDAHYQVAAIQARQIGAGESNDGADLYFFTKSDGPGVGEDNPRLVINNIGHVGIGTTNPGLKLTVNTGGSNGGIQIQSTAGQNIIRFYQTDAGMNLKCLQQGIYAGKGYISGVNDTFNDETYRFFTFDLSNGLVGIGTNSPEYKLDVVGKIRAHEIIVNTQKQSDYVFEDSYPLLPLEKVEEYTKKNKCLPNIPSAQDVEKNGLNMGEMQTRLLEKIEELTLYAIEQNKKIEQQQKEISELKNNQALLMGMIDK